MCAESIMRHQLLGNSPSEVRFKATTDVYRCKLSLLGCQIPREFPTFEGEVRPFRVRLRANRYIFAGSHGECPRDETGNPG
jgi:hypothetical protein